MGNVILIILVIAGITVPSLVCLVLRSKNTVLKAENQGLEEEWTHLSDKYDKLEEKNLQFSYDLSALATELDAAEQAEATALYLLETQVSEGFDRPVPARIMTQIGREGVYYEFEWDPPEQAEIHPIQGSKAT